MKRAALTLGLIALFSLVAAAVAEPQEDESALRADHSNVIRFSGVLREAGAKPSAAAVSMTFTLYADEAGAVTLWSEVQNVRPNRQGRYTVLLGAENPLPADIFAGDAARWLGARAGDRETRTLLVSVPYALKAAFSTHAANAETLGGVPAANFVTRNELSTSNSMMVMAGSVVPLAANGTAGKIPMFTSTDATNADLGNSVMTQLGGGAIDCTDASPCIGIGTATPLRSLHIKGTDGALVFDAGSAPSNPVLFFAHDNFASPFRNRIMLSRTDESMQIWTASVPRVTVRASGDIMEVAGVIKTTGGIRFPDNSLLTSAAAASGDITQVTAGAGLSGGGTTGAVSLSVMTCTTGQILKSNGAGWACMPDNNSGGDITAVVAGTGLTGGATSGDATLAVNTVLRTRGINYIAGCDTCSALADTDDQKVIYVNVLGSPLTISEVRCYSDAGTPTIQLQRDDGTAANILSASLSCSTAGGVTNTFAPAEVTLNNNEKIDFVMTSAGGQAKRVTVVIKAVLN